MELKDLLSLYFERTNAMQTFWTFYVTIILGLLAFFGSTKLPRKPYGITFILSLAFCMFAFVNLQALRGVTRQRNVTKDLIVASHLEHTPDGFVAMRIRPTLDPPTESGVIAVHISGDILTIGAMWFLAFKKTQGE
jgi:hypothetical protein